MDKELLDYFEDFDIDDNRDEAAYQRRARLVGEQFERKMETAGKSLRFAQDLVALFRYFLDSSIAWQKKTIVVAALAYFILPFDAMPDIAPFIGYLDDFGVIAAVTKFISDELAAYYPR